MSVTLDVFQLETSSLNVSKLVNSPRMSVIDETTQPEIGPYVLRAAARALTHIWTALSREALVAKDGGACAQTFHPALLTLPSDDHVKEALPSTSPLGEVVPLYVAPFTISVSQQLSVLKAVALRNWPTARLVGVIVHDWEMP